MELSFNVPVKFTRSLTAKIPRDQGHGMHETFKSVLSYTPYVKDFPRSFVLDREALDNILKQPACYGVRAYLALRDITLGGGISHEFTLILVGVDVNGNNIFVSTALDDGEIYDNFKPCPTYCPTNEL